MPSGGQSARVANAATAMGPSTKNRIKLAHTTNDNRAPGYAASPIRPSNSLSSSTVNATSNCESNAGKGGCDAPSAAVMSSDSMCGSGLLSRQLSTAR